MRLEVRGLVEGVGVAGAAAQAVGLLLGNGRLHASLIRFIV